MQEKKVALLGMHMLMGLAYQEKAVFGGVFIHP